METTSKKTKTILIQRTFDLPLSTVWKAWEDESIIKKWWGPNNYSCTYAKIDFKVGGKCLLNMEDKNGGKTMWSTGTYKEIIPLKKILVTDSFCDEKGNIISATEAGMPNAEDMALELLITLKFEDKDGKTALTVKHEGLPEEVYNDCVQGWEESLDKLEKNVK